MKVLAAIGVLVLLAGGYILVRGLSLTTKRDTVEVGPFSASVEEKQSVPPWVGGVAVGVGLVMIIAGVGSRKRT